MQMCAPICQCRRANEIISDCCAYRPTACRRLKGNSHHLRGAPLAPYAHTRPHMIPCRLSFGSPSWSPVASCMEGRLKAEAAGCFRCALECQHPARLSTRWYFSTTKRRDTLPYDPVRMSLNLSTAFNEGVTRCFGHL